MAARRRNLCPCQHLILALLCCRGRRGRLAKMAVLAAKRRMLAPPQSWRKKKSAAFCCREGDDCHGFLYHRHSRLVSLGPYPAWQSRFISYVNVPFVVILVCGLFFLMTLSDDSKFWINAIGRSRMCEIAFHTHARTQLWKLQRHLLSLTYQKETHERAP